MLHGQSIRGAVEGPTFGAVIVEQDLDDAVVDGCLAFGFACLFADGNAAIGEDFNGFDDAIGEGDFPFPNRKGVFVGSVSGRGEKGEASDQSAGEDAK